MAPLDLHLRTRRLVIHTSIPLVLLDTFYLDPSMTTELKRPFTSVLGVREDILPPDVALSIQRVLSLGNTPDEDPLDTFSNGFNPVDILNSYFPNGEQHDLFLSFPRQFIACLQRLP